MAREGRFCLVTMLAIIGAYNLLEDEVDAGKLLECLQQAARQKPFSDIAAEAIEVSGLAKL